jgi:hypothetical protein
MSNTVYDAKITGQKAVAGGVIGTLSVFIASKVSALVVPILGDDPAITGAIYAGSTAVLTSVYNVAKFFLRKYWGQT